MNVAPLSLPEGSQHLNRRRISQPAGGILLFLVTLSVCLLGILLRGPGLLSSFWVANAVLLGLLVLSPSLATVSGLLAAAAGYVTADLLTGSDLLKTLLLTTGNMSGVLTGYALFRAIGFEDVKLSRPFSLGILVAVALTASATAGLIGTIISPILFSQPPLESFFFWSATEFTNYIAILPVLLTAPALLRSASRLKLAHTLTNDPMTVLPLATGIASVIVAPALPGASAIALPLPALVWCALVYSVPLTALLSFMCATWMLITMTLVSPPADFPLNTAADLISLRIAVTLLCLPPVLIASIMQARAEALQEAAQARDAAEKAMSARALLLATMAHELRSPLNSIVGLASLIEMKPKGNMEPVNAKEYAAHIRESGMHLAQLVTDLLDTAKVEAGEAELALTEALSRQVVEQSLHLVRGLAIQASVEIKVAGEEWPDIIADQRAIKQVLINLLSNAVKHSPRGSVVTISASVETDAAKGERLHISVKDNGSGISAEDLKRLGRPYQQAHGKGASRPAGTGLGLALSKRLIQQHGGTLRLESALGKGTTATFDLTVA